MSQSRKEPYRPTLMQSILIGSAAGATETIIGHPLWSIKTRLQCRDPFTLNPIILYRGFFTNVASMVPITAIQVGMNRFLQPIFISDPDHISNNARIACAFVAGVSSAFASCPTEMIMTYQKSNGGNFYASAKAITKYGSTSAIMTGLCATAMREGIFTAAFLGITPLWKRMLVERGHNDEVAAITAGMSAGALAAVASQAIDTIKTTQQAAPIDKPISIINAASKIYSSGGIGGFFKGGLARGGRIMAGVTAMGIVAEKLSNQFATLQTRNKHI